MRVPLALRVVLAVAILAGVFFRVYHLDRKVYWEDEVVGTVRALGYTEAHIVAVAPGIADAAGLQKYFHPATPAMGGDRLADTVKSLAAEDPQHPPLYYVLSHVWMDRFGSSVAAIRALPVLFGLLALPVAYWLAFELFGSATIALLATALLAISPFHVLYAQEAREYSLWTLAILC
ncbi:MAG: glycosyltransferase family 39 protein, partial [Candidatus Eremiobacteraeota bacterium]|nr:glycosyltransferase family 39 protein [Candidatus Eremiobacteraeota bacterium]